MASRKRTATIRTLRTGERIPNGEPRRYPNDQGYIRLRWLVGTQTYVECYEHRVADGYVTDAEHVHHDNTVKDDNRPANLVPLTADEHNALHAERNRGKRTWHPYRSKRDFDRAQRRAERRRLIEQMRSMYVDEGASTVEIARRLGIHPSNVSRSLWTIGFRPSERAG